MKSQSYGVSYLVSSSAATMVPPNMGKCKTQDFLLLLESIRNYVKLGIVPESIRSKWKKDFILEIEHSRLLKPLSHTFISKVNYKK